MGGNIGTIIGIKNNDIISYIIRFCFPYIHSTICDNYVRTGRRGKIKIILCHLNNFTINFYNINLR